MTWGGLNNALTAWRTAVMKRFPDKDTASDGARADAAHGSTSQHQADADSTVDAYDMDVNVLAGSPASGTAVERRIVEAMKLDFERDPHARGQLWIHQREIANRDRSNWLERDYTGPNPHDKHVHWESRQSHEDDGSAWPMPHTDALLRELRGDDDVALTAAEIKAIAKEVVEQTRAALVDDDNGLGFQARRVPWAYPMPIEGEPSRMMVGAVSDIEDRLARIEAAVGRLEQAIPPGAPGA